MASKTLEQVLSSLSSTFDPQIKGIQQRQQLIPQQIQAEEQGLQARQTQAFDDILGGARRRGLGFSGIPLSEQARYTSTEFLPAMARLRQSGREQALSLEDALLGINERRRSMGQSIFENERNFGEQQRQFNQQMKLQRDQLAAQQRAAASAAWKPNLGSLDNPTQSGAVQRKDKGYDFKDQFGNPISAAAYAYATNTPFRQLLQTMANAGDVGAKTALGFVGDDYGYDPNKIGKNSGLYNSLVWGMGRQYSPGLSVGNAQPNQRLVVR